MTYPVTSLVESNIIVRVVPDVAALSKAMPLLKTFTAVATDDVDVPSLTEAGNIPL